MNERDLRAAVRASIAAIAPETDLQALRDDLPLRTQVDLDSMDRVNLLAELQRRLGLDCAQLDLAASASVDAIVAQLSALPPVAGPAAAAPGRRTLRLDGQVVTIRPVVPGDLAQELEFFRRLSPEARYKKFMVQVRDLPPSKLRQIAAVDQQRHVALIALADGDGRQQAPVGIARYVVDDDGTGCEFAIAVDDAFQRSGLAGVLMQDLMTLARDRGLDRIHGVVLASNLKMVKFARQLGFSVEHEPGDYATVRIERRL